MHPVIRLAVFFLFIIGVTTAQLYFLLLILPVLGLLLYLYSHAQLLWRTFKRLKWLFLSLFILNAWFSAPTFTGLPSQFGLLLALQRLSMLASIISAAHLLQHTTPSAHMILALQWWLTPFGKLGVNVETIAVRLALTLDTVHTVQKLYDDLPAVTKTATHSPRARLNYLAKNTSQLFTQTLYHAEHTPLTIIELPALPPLLLWQWCYPCILVLLLTVN